MAHLGKPSISGLRRVYDAGVMVLSMENVVYHDGSGCIEIFDWK